MSEPLCHIRTNGPLAPTHTLRRIVTAFRIYATDEIGTHQRLTVIADGECAHISVTADLCLHDTPVPGDWLVIGADGDVSHMRDEAFQAQAIPVPRANAGITERPRVPRFPG